MIVFGRSAAGYGDAGVACQLGEAGGSATMIDRFNFERFIEAQEPLFDKVRQELRAGQKEGHWMWFIFPQIAGLGQSPMSIRFAISSSAEAVAYLAHPVLGPRLRECAKLVLDVEGRTARQIFGPVDELKFRSSMTLFAKASPEDNLFRRCLEKYFAGDSDPATLARI
jgi:uncharacterized protein (DUF1810 family)